MKLIHEAAVGVLMVMFAGAAMAAGDQASDSAMDSGSTQSSVSAPDLSGSYKSSDLRGMDVKNADDQTIGSISELIVDADGKVSHVLLSEGGVAGIGAKEYIVPWDRVRLTPGENVAVIDVTQDALQSEFAAFEEEKSPTAGERKEKKSSEEKSEGDYGKSGGM